MNKLDIERINILSPYEIWSKGNVLFFTTDNGVEYSVDFDPEESPFFTAYWLNLTNLNFKSSPNDKKIPQTLICIIEEFFRQNPDILLYMCSTANGQQAQRARLFLRWFNGAEQQQHYYIQAVEVKGEGHQEYVALIVPRTHPQLEDVISRFNEETAMFDEMKP